MKKEDLCMLLLVVALLLIVSRKTKLFEGMENLGIPGLDELLGEDDQLLEGDELLGENGTPEPAPLPVKTAPKVPPTPKKTPPPPAPKKTPPPPAPKRTPPPPAPKRTPPPPAPKRTPPSVAPKPTPPSGEKKASPFGSPLIEGKGAFGEGWLNAWDSNADVYASTGKDDEYGEKIPLSMQQEYLTMKSLGTLTPQIMQNLGEQRSQGEVLGTDFKPWDPSTTSGALLDNQFEGIQGVKAPAQPKTVTFDTPSQPTGGPSGGKPIEVHMVYGDWCGHSKNAKPAFQELVSDTSVKTASGSPVKFVMTPDDSPGMEQFKETVTGFPSYMVVKPDGPMEKLEGHDRTKESIKNAVQKLN